MNFEELPLTSVFSINSILYFKNSRNTAYGVKDNEVYQFNKDTEVVKETDIRVDIYPVYDEKNILIRTFYVFCRGKTFIDRISIKRKVYDR